MSNFREQAIIVDLETININLKLDIKRYVDKLYRNGKITEEEYQEFINMLNLEAYLQEI